MKHLHQYTVLVLNRNWQAVNVTTPADALSSLVAGTCQGLDIDPEQGMMPSLWESWKELPIREYDQAVRTSSQAIRVPTVVVLNSYSQVPLKSLKFGFKGIWERDGGTCQYTGRELSVGEANIDHIIPQSRGGETSWENCVLADRRVNQRKAARTPQEAGLQLVKQPSSPKAVPVSFLIKNTLEIRDWEHFLAK